MPKKQYKVRIFFGEAISDALGEGDRKEAKRIYTDGDAAYIERTFATEGEKQAYLQALVDLDGWMGHYILQDGERTPEWAKNAA